MFKLILLSIITTFLFADSTSIANSALNKYGSKSGLNNNLMQPLQTGSTLHTLDDSKSFNASVNKSCPSSADGITVTFNVASDNTYTITIRQDVDLNGVKEYTYNYPNSIISTCSQGVEWKSGSTRYYGKFSLDTSKRLTIIPTTQNDVGVCFCSNNSCDYTFDMNIVNNITGAIMTTISNTNSNLVVGDSSYNSATKTYSIFLTDMTTCNNSNNLYGNNYTGSNPQSYYGSQTIPNLSIGNIAAQDDSNEHSLYFITKQQNSVIVNDSANQITTPTNKECTVLNKIEKNADGNDVVVHYNNCLGYENNTSCSIRHKIICEYDGHTNCLYATKDGAGTTAVINTHCVDLTSQKKVCDSASNIKLYTNNILTSALQTSANNSWFYTKYIYNCGNEIIHYDKSGSDKALTTAKFNANYEIDYTCPDGSTKTIKNLPQGDNCPVKACSVRSITKSTHEFYDHTNNHDTEDGSSVNSLSYKTCNEVSVNNFVCPLESGDTLIEDCSCTLGMAGATQAIAGFSAIEKIAEDFSCSTN